MQRRKCIYNLSHGFELHSIRYRILVIALDFCCIYIGLVFIKDRPVSSFWVLRFRVLGASFSSFGASFSSFGASFSSASFSKLPVWAACENTECRLQT